MFLEEIIGDVRLEGVDFECKSVLNRDDVLGWLKTVAGFANAGGGTIYIGVEDKTNKLIGFDRKKADAERNYFNNQVNEHLTPRPRIEVDFLPYKIRGNEKFIIRSKIFESSVKPVVLKYKNVPSIYMRRDGFTNGATYEEIIEMSIRSKRTQYDVLTSDVEFDETKITKLREFHRRYRDGKELSAKALRSMGFMDEDGMLANGAVLFLDDYNGAKTEVQCSVFSGFNKGSERIVSVNRFKGNLTDTIDYMMSFIGQRMNHGIVKKDEGRINIDSFPKRALFEGVINAVAHRDYYLDGTQIQLDMYRDRLEISSPGGFYRGERFGKTYDLLGVISKRRNELISHVLVACNVMEAAGTGFDKISEEYAEADEMHKPYIYSTSDHFTLVLPDMTYADGVNDGRAPAVTFVPVPDGTVYDERVLGFCYQHAHKAAEIADFLGLRDSTYFRKTVLANLETHGYIVSSKQSRATYYKTNREMVSLE